MLSSLRFILKSQLKRQSNRGGFTLIELLVALIMAALIITPVLGFMINFLQTDRREQAKTTTEQDIQSALDYIAQDMQQAVYIYDLNGLNGTGDNGISDELGNSLSCPANATCQPILAFWKRRFLSRTDRINGTVVGSLTNNNDAFVYSLVAYSLVDASNAEKDWSSVARIVRYELRGDLTTKDGSIPSDPAGFVPFNLEGSGNLSVKMNRWAGSPTTAQTGATLVDYIDEPGSGTLTVSCSTNEQRIPPPNTGINGFVVCLNLLQRTIPTAQVYIRGNAFARLQNNAPYSEGMSTFFPKSSVLVRGNGFLFTQ
ncbi:MAG: hormogonium polysaccharide secretion pseudopilin HpsC [Coleofasciculus chthonoplastes F3-SA18-01]|uniref:hormogonium polysaccharide secretion pseudopilin HpsC n=1 Tax=Coleofasciculus chthonoplastes TaxID=64178 RepID=UPI0032F838A4